MRLLSFFEEENPRRILIPRGRLLLFFLLLLLFEIAVCLSFYQIFIILSLFLAIPTVYLWRFGWKLWQRYYARAWYPVCVFLVSGAALAIRWLIYGIFT